MAARMCGAPRARRVSALLHKVGPFLQQPTVCHQLFTISQVTLSSSQAHPNPD